jgi:hypothetical protein
MAKKTFEEWLSENYGNLQLERVQKMRHAWESSETESENEIYRLKLKVAKLKAKVADLKFELMKTF